MDLGAPALVAVAVVAGCAFALARGLGFGLGFKFEVEVVGGGMSVATEGEMGGKEVEVAVEADEAGSVLLDEREFQLAVLRSAMDYAAIGIGDNSLQYSVVTLGFNRRRLNCPMSPADRFDPLQSSGEWEAGGAVEDNQIAKLVEIRQTLENLE
ncbi:hypothetical protein J7T55_013874 [Diaporthe amygdali]|uniref:uncharacterized protein n=1 Tax=Phomopsis amygdali TaxID=1214568 RepID=UPI0022FE1FE6|nr:uncharacterized protein J7T55_013874 [Diaporthe amygdali]KAJ0119671.1 hypothetical protein J7T55_013874 [Diaporthe amygdali]